MPSSHGTSYAVYYTPVVAPTAESVSPGGSQCRQPVPARLPDDVDTFVVHVLVLLEVDLVRTPPPPPPPPPRVSI